MFLSFEEMPTEDRPPRRIWLDGDALKEHMVMVKERREAEMRGEDHDREIEDPEQNDLTKGLREKLRRG